MHCSGCVNHRFTLVPAFIIVLGIAASCCSCSPEHPSPAEVPPQVEIEKPPPQPTPKEPQPTPKELEQSRLAFVQRMKDESRASRDIQDGSQVRQLFAAQLGLKLRDKGFDITVGTYARRLVVHGDIFTDTATRVQTLQMIRAIPDICGVGFREVSIGAGLFSSDSYSLHCAEQE